MIIDSTKAPNDAKPLLAPVRVLNLYACLGGNRLLWENCEVTAVELDPEAAKLYQERFPNDKVIVADAHQYLLDHYKEFDFIWSSPPCPSHSKVRITQKTREKFKFIYPDMKLYEEVIFLDNFFDGKYDSEEAIRLLKRNSRRYAKRQLTWFKRDPEVHWYAPDQNLGITPKPYVKLSYTSNRKS